MKKFILLVSLVGILFFANKALAKAEPVNQPNKTILEKSFEVIINKSLKVIWDEIKIIKKQIAEIKQKKCYQCDSGSQTADGLKKAIYTGVVPDNLEDADLDVHILGGDDDHYYFKKVEIPEIQLSNMPSLTLYTKIDEEIGDLIEEDLWEKNDGNLFFENGTVYIRYANDNEDGVYYFFPNDKSYKIVVIY